MMRDREQSQQGEQKERTDVGWKEIASNASVSGNSRREPTRERSEGRSDRHGHVHAHDHRNNNSVFEKDSRREKEKERSRRIYESPHREHRREHAYKHRSRHYSGRRRSRENREGTRRRNDRESSRHKRKEGRSDAARPEGHESKKEDRHGRESCSKREYARDGQRSCSRQRGKGDGPSIRDSETASTGNPGKEPNKENCNGRLRGHLKTEDEGKEGKKRIARQWEGYSYEHLNEHAQRAAHARERDSDPEKEIDTEGERHVQQNGNDSASTSSHHHQPSHAIAPNNHHLPRNQTQTSHSQSSSRAQPSQNHSTGQTQSQHGTPQQQPGSSALNAQGQSRVYPPGYAYKLVYEDPSDIENPRAKCHKRVQGKVSATAGPNLERLNYLDKPKDPRGMHRFTFQCSTLSVPEFIIDEYYVTTPPQREVGIFELNDNVDQKILSEIVRKIGETREIFVYMNPKTARHMRMGAIIFKDARHAQKFVEDFGEKESEATEKQPGDTPRRKIMGTAIQAFLDPYLTLVNERYEELVGCAVPLPKHLRSLSSEILFERREAILAEKRGLPAPPPAPILAPLPTTPPVVVTTNDSRHSHKKRTSGSPERKPSTTRAQDTAHIQKPSCQTPPTPEEETVSLPPPPPTPTLPPPPMPPDYLMGMMHINGGGYTGQNNMSVPPPAFHRLQATPGQRVTNLPPPGVIQTPVLAAPATPATPNSAQKRNNHLIKMEDVSPPQLIVPPPLASHLTAPPTTASPATPPTQAALNNSSDTPKATPAISYTESLEARVKNVFSDLITAPKPEPVLSSYTEPIRPESSIDMSINGEEDMDVEFSSDLEEETAEEKAEREKKEKEELKREADQQVRAVLRRTCEELQKVVLNDLSKKMEAAGRQRVEIFLLNRKLEEEQEKKKQQEAAPFPAMVKQETSGFKPTAANEPITSYMQIGVSSALSAATSAPVSGYAPSPLLSNFTSFLPKFPSFKRKAHPQHASSSRRLSAAQAASASKGLHAQDADSISRSASAASTNSSTTTSSSRSSSPAAVQSQSQSDDESNSSSSSESSDENSDEEEIKDSEAEAGGNESVPSPSTSSGRTSASDAMLMSKSKATAADRSKNKRRLLSSEDSIESRSAASSQSDDNGEEVDLDVDMEEAEENVPPPIIETKTSRKRGRAKKEVAAKHKFIQVKEVDEENSRDSVAVSMGDQDSMTSTMMPPSTADAETDELMKTINNVAGGLTSTATSSSSLLRSPCSKSLTLNSSIKCLPTSAIGNVRGGVPVSALLDPKAVIQPQKREEERAQRPPEKPIWTEAIRADEYHTHLVEHCYPKLWAKSEDELVEENVRAIFSKVSGHMLQTTSASAQPPSEPITLPSPVKKAPPPSQLLLGSAKKRPSKRSHAMVTGPTAAVTIPEPISATPAVAATKTTLSQERVSNELLKLLSSSYNNIPLRPISPDEPARLIFPQRSADVDMRIADQWKENLLDREDQKYLSLAYEENKRDDLRFAEMQYVPPARVLARPTRIGRIEQYYDDPELDGLLPHGAGCARAYGYHKMDQKMKTRLIRRPEQCTASTSISLQDETVVRHQVQANKESKAMHRKLLNTMEMPGSNEFFKVNQLKYRKKMIKFARSRIHGWGLYAMEPIAPDDMIVEYVGQKIRPTVADVREVNYTKKGIGSSYLFRIDDTCVIDATKQGNFARFINHSCQPNCYAKIVTVDGEKRIVIYSKRLIAKGEEITYDYKFPIEDDKIDCLCGAPNCRGTLN